MLSWRRGCRGVRIVGSALSLGALVTVRGAGGRGMVGQVVTTLVAERRGSHRDRDRDATPSLHAVAGPLCAADALSPRRGTGGGRWGSPFCRGYPDFTIGITRQKLFRVGQKDHSSTVNQAAWTGVGHYLNNLKTAGFTKPVYQGSVNDDILGQTVCVCELSVFTQTQNMVQTQNLRTKVKGF